MEEEELNIEELRESIRKIKPDTIIKALVGCLVFLMFYLGFIYGFNQAYTLQKEYYEPYMIRHCICQEKPTYTMQPVNINFYKNDS